MASEQTIQKQIVKYLESLPNSFVFVTITSSKSGIPDIIACVNGLYVGIEVKKPGKLDTVSPIQQHQLAQIREAKGLALVASCVADVSRHFEVSDEGI